MRRNALMLLKGNKPQALPQLGEGFGTVLELPGKMNRTQGRNLFQHGKILISSMPFLTQQHR